MATARVTQQGAQVAVKLTYVRLQLKVVFNASDQRRLERRGVGDPFGHRSAALAFGAKRSEATRHPPAGRTFRL